MFQPLPFQLLFGRSPVRRRVGADLEEHLGVAKLGRPGAVDVGGLR